jgi:hypothetical protein
MTAKSNETDQKIVTSAPTNPVRQLLDEQFDIYSIALSKTFNEQLSKQRSERFVLHKTSKNHDSGDMTQSKSNVAQTTESNKGQETRCKIEKRSVNPLDKYKGSALECIPDPQKFNQLSIDDSLQLGKEQKYKDFELERQKFIKRLSWRQVTQFDSDSELSEPQTDSDCDSDN